VSIATEEPHQSGTTSGQVRGSIGILKTQVECVLILYKLG